LVAAKLRFCDKRHHHGAGLIAHGNSSRSKEMGSLSIWHWILVILVVVLLFGRGKISDLMGDVAKGIKSFKKGLSDEETQVTDAAKSLENQASDAVKQAADKVKS
jgi:sec-independent protein translocase protein TatA